MTPTSSTQTVRASAPSNIALIKYMGKTLESENKPTNSSLSYTLEHLRTIVEIQPIAGEHDDWAPLKEDGLLAIELSEKGRQKFLNHFRFLKESLGLSGAYLLKSGNTFPSDCGLASSASSFAALTLAASRLAEEKGKEIPDVFELAQLSRKGSGSSCRSFFGPWVMWGQEGLRPLEFPMAPLLHSVIVVENSIKEVSSSEAHRRVPSSPLFSQRPLRADNRMAKLIRALRENDWNEARDLCWAEFWDMHALFETSTPAFGYFRPGTLEVLNALRQDGLRRGDGPLVTMDAGPNIHLLFREDQKDLKQELTQMFSTKFTVYSADGT